jgi:hypothetical protein
VPQEYLRGFQMSDNVGEIWLYDKKDRVDRVVPIKKAAQSPGFYDDDVERRLAELEGEAHAALKRVRATGAIDGTAREVLACYVAVMLYRTPRHRRQNVERIPVVREE